MKVHDRYNISAKHQIDGTPNHKSGSLPDPQQWSLAWVFAKTFVQIGSQRDKMPCGRSSDVAFGSCI